MSTDSDEPQVEEVRVEDEHQVHDRTSRCDIVCNAIIVFLAIICCACLVTITVFVIRSGKD
jgi:hypothetical protein